MKEYDKDTSENYDTLVGYVADDNIRSDLGKFLGEKTEYKPEINPKVVDEEFKEPWQTMYVNFDSPEDYAEFMRLIGKKPIHKLKEFIFEDEDEVGLSKFFGE